MNIRRIPNIRSDAQERGANWSPGVLVEQKVTTRFQLLEWWYRLSTPGEPPATADVTEREAARRARLTSTILLILIATLLLILPITTTTTSHVLLPLLFVALLVAIGAVMLNHFGRVVLAGSLIVTAITVAFVISLLTTPGGLGAYNLPTFDLLVISELLAVSLLPPEAVFIVGGVNSIFIWLTLIFERRASDLTILFKHSGYSLLIRPIILQIIVAVVTYLWVRGTRQAIVRADRAEVVASLQHAIAEQEHTVAQQKRQLDASIQQIVETHTRVANGDMHARVPLTNENVLWQIAGSLNNLIARLQRLRQDSYELQKIKEQIPYLIAVVRQAQEEHHTIQFTRSGTALDPLLHELNTRRT